MFYKVLVSPEEGFRWALYSNHRGQKNSFTLNYTEKTLSFPVGPLLFSPLLLLIKMWMFIFFLVIVSLDSFTYAILVWVLYNFVTLSTQKKFVVIFSLHPTIHRALFSAYNLR